MVVSPSFSREGCFLKGWWLSFLLPITILMMMVLFFMISSPPFMEMAEGEATGGEVVYVIPIKGTIDPGLAEFIKRGLSEAKGKGVDGVLVEIDTFGGRVDAATEIRDLLLDSEVPVITFVLHRAWSAGALIAIAGEKLVMAPASSIGAAETRPAEQKIISAFAAEFRATAEARGRDPNIAAAMVDADIAIEGIVKEGQLLTLSALEGKRLGFIDGIAKDRGEACDVLGLRAPHFVEAKLTRAESVARFLTDPTVSSILLTLGFLGLIFEILTPGWGVAGTTGLISLALFYGGRMIVGLAGWELVLLFLVGLILVGLEAFVIPGFGIAGISGLLAILLSIGMSFATPQQALRSIVGALILTTILTFLGFRYLPRSRIGSPFILSTRQEKGAGYVAPQDMSWAEGKMGRTLTILRPVGTVEIDGLRFDAMSEGEYIEKNAEVVVIRVEGNKVVVREVPGQV